MGAKVYSGASLAKPYAQAVFSYAKACSKDDYSLDFWGTCLSALSKLFEQDKGKENKVKVDYSLNFWSSCLSILSQLVEQDKVSVILADPGITQIQKIDFLLGMLLDAFEKHYNKNFNLSLDVFNMDPIEGPFGKVSNFVKLVFENNRVSLLPAINAYY